MTTDPAIEAARDIIWEPVGGKPTLMMAARTELTRRAIAAWCKARATELKTGTDNGPQFVAAFLTLEAAALRGPVLRSPSEGGSDGA